MPSHVPPDAQILAMTREDPNSSYVMSALDCESGARLSVAVVSSPQLLAAHATVSRKRAITVTLRADRRNFPLAHVHLSENEDVLEVRREPPPRPVALKG